MLRRPEEWASLDAATLAQFARDWLLELNDDPSVADRDVGMEVVAMNFTAPAEVQWAFILEAVAGATTDGDLGHIAAGPIEHLLGFHGKDYIDRLEAQSNRDGKFACALTGLRQHLMDCEVWARVQAIQTRVPEPLARNGK